MKNWKNWILVLLFLLLVGSFWLIWEKYPKEVIKIEMREDERKIDSLEFVIKGKTLVIDSLKKCREVIKERVIVKVERVKTLSPDSTIRLFCNNLQEYGDIEEVGEPVLREDSGVICSLDNLRGANVIAAKYEGKVEEIEVLDRTVKTSFEIITDKDSIIRQNSVILMKTRDSYEVMLENLDSQLKKEVKKKKAVTYGGAILVGLLSGLLIFGR